MEGQKKSIGILGGMGPLATADLLRKIVILTKASCDNEHIRVYIDSNAAIPDRTAAILNGGPDPLPEMASALRHLEACGADCILMPCNTAHYFLPRLQEMTGIPFLNMPEITAKRCAERFPGRRAAILATDGTVQTGIYDRALSQRGVAFLHPDREEQKTVMHLIRTGQVGGPAMRIVGPILARMGRPSSLAFSSSTRITPAEASFMPDELPAVTQPSSLNTGLSLESFS